MTAAGDQREGGSTRAAEEAFADLRARISRKLPEWNARGPEDPGWALIEALAEALAELRVDVETLDERLLPLALEALGEEPAWPVAARSAVVFSVDPNAGESILIPRGTVAAAERRTGEPHLAFTTENDAWASAALLLRAVAETGGRAAEIIPYPQGGWDAESVPLFGERTEVDRHLYAGDPALLLLREGGTSLTLEWPGSPPALSEGQWEYSVRDGWRSLPVEIEEARPLAPPAAAKGAPLKRAVHVRITGPLPDLAEERIDSAMLPWIRLSLPPRRRVALHQPSWVKAEADAAWPEAAGDGAGAHPDGRLPASFPRPVQRLLSRGGECWEDHSLVPGKVLPAEASEAADPALYLGWDRPGHVSVFIALAGAPAPPGWEGDGERAPQIEWEYSARRGFRPLEVTDLTQGFLRSGAVTWRAPADWGPQERLGERLHWARARWVGGAYPAVRRVGALIPGAAGAIQSRTVTHHLCAVRLDRTGRGAFSLSLPDGEPAAIAGVEVKTETGWRSHGPARRLPRGGYAIDLGPVATGEVTLKVPELRLTHGTRGNVPAGTITVLEGEIPGIVKVSQPLPAAGGRDAETAEAYRRRVRAEWKVGDRAVTRADYERLARALDAEIERVECDWDPSRPGKLLVTVIPDDPCRPGRFSSARLAWLAEALGRKAPLGTVVEVVEPAYLPIRVVARAGDGADSPPEEARRRLEDALRRHLHPLRGGREGSGFRMPRCAREEDLAAMVKEALAGASAEREPGWRRGASGEAGPWAWERGSWRIDIAGDAGESLPGLSRSVGFPVHHAADGPGRPALGSPPAAARRDARPVVVFPILDKLVFET